MVTQDAIIKIIISLPEAKAVNEDANYWKKVIPDIMPAVLDEITMAYDWDFTLETYETVTVANTAEYTLTGKNNDLRDIIDIRYDDNEVLQKMRPLDAHALLHDGGTVTGVKGWYQSGVDNRGFPKVTLIGTPTTAGKAIKVYYRKKNIELAMFPNDFSWVIIRGVLGWLSDSKRRAFDNALNIMVKRHKIGGKDINRTPMDNHVVATNRKISDLYGVG